MGSPLSTLWIVVIVFAVLSSVVVEARLAGGMVVPTTTDNNNEDKDNDDDDHRGVIRDFLKDFTNHKNNNNNKNDVTKMVGGGGGGCDVLRPDELPEECVCTEPSGPFSLVLECLKEFDGPFFNDTIGMKIAVDPCNPLGASVSVDVLELDHDIDYPITGIRAGEEKNFPIPGLAVVVPPFGHLGVDVAVLVYGNPDLLTLKVGLNACVGVDSDHTKCASELPVVRRILPWYVLSGTYTFGNYCNSTHSASSEQ